MNLNKIKMNPLDAIGIVFLIVTILTFIVPYFQHNDYFVDEAMLANSLFTRGIFSLGASPLDYSQSAPLGYLYFVKLLTLIFGNSTVVTRLPSLITSLLMLPLCYKISKELLSIKYPLFITGFVGLSGLIIHYAANFKQYSLETLIVLICLYCMGLYYQKRINLFFLNLIFSVILWFAFSSLFFILGILAVIFFYTFTDFIKKETSFSGFTKNMGMFLIPCISVIANLLIWIFPSTGNIGQEQYAYWGKLSFPLIPTKISDVVLMARMAYHITSSIGRVMALPLLLAFVLFVLNIKDYKNRCVFSIVLSFLVILIASYFGKFPIQNRLFLFVYPLFTLFIWLMAEKYLSSLQKTSTKRILVIILCLIFTVNAGRTVIHSMSSSIYPRQQLSYNLEYLENNMNQNDCVYVYPAALPGYSYLTNYAHPFNNHLSLPTQNGNIMYGASFRKLSAQSKAYEYVFEFDTNILQENVNMIFKNNIVYIIIAHDDESSFEPLLNELAKHGKIELVHEVYQTPLYRFERWQTGE
jgi:hypothetical protein